MVQCVLSLCLPGLAMQMSPLSPDMGVEGEYMAHGYCFAWEKSLVALHVTSDLVTGLAYYAISAAIFYFTYRRRDLPFLKIFILFGVFILACGTTHLFGALTVFRPDYWPEGWVKAITGLVSVVAAVLFIPLMPEAIALPSLKAKMAEAERLNMELRITDQALQQVTDAILWIGEDGRILRANEAARRALGYPGEELLGLDIRSIQPQFTEVGWQEHWARLQAEGAIRQEAQLRRRDGWMLEVEVSSSLIATENHAFACLVARDIALRKADEARLAAESTRLQTLIRSIPDLVWLKDPEGVYLYCNPRFEAFFGAPEAKILGRTDYDFMGKELADLFRSYDLRAMEAGGPSVNEEWVTFASDGHRELLETIKTPLVDATGRCLGVLGIGRDITRLREDQERLRKLSSAVEHSPVVVVITDRAGAIEYVNPRFTELTGYTLEETLGDNPRIQKSGTTPSETYEELWNTITAGGTWRGELQNRKKNGDLYWEAISISPITDETGVITHFVALKEDITERKAAEQALATSEKRYHGLFHAMKEGFALHEILLDEAGRPSDYRFLDVNPAFAEMMGIPRERWIGQTVKELMPELGSAWLETFGQVAKTGQPTQFEGYLTPLQRWFHVFVFALGERQLAVLAFDITERVEVQSELQKSEQQFRTLTENLPYIIARFDRELRHLYVNPAIEAATGLTPGAFIGKTNEELGQPRALVEFWNGKLLEVFHTAKVQSLEFTFPTPSGERIYASILVPECNREGIVESVLSVGKDITQQRQEDRANQAQLEELRRWHEAMLGRETRILDLKGEVNELRVRLGLPLRYTPSVSATPDDDPPEGGSL